MIDDLAGPARAAVAAFGVALGLVLGGAYAAGPDASASPRTATGLVVAGLLLETAVLVGTAAWLRRGEGRLRDRVVAGAARAAQAGRPAPARVVRRRAEPRRASTLPGAGACAPPSQWAVLEVLTDAGARRVTALVPVDLGLGPPGAPALVLLHPDDPQVAVVDDRVTLARLGEVDADPRWRAEPLPTDRMLLGGWSPLVAALLAGVAGGFAAGSAVAVLG